jgi:hypothetical protein
MAAMNTRPNRPIRSISVADGQTEQTDDPIRVGRFRSGQSAQRNGKVTIMEQRGNYDD